MSDESKELEQKGGDLSDKMIELIGGRKWQDYSLNQKINYVKGAHGGFNLGREDIERLPDNYREMRYELKTIRMAVDVIDDLSKQLTATQQALDSSCQTNQILVERLKVAAAALEYIEFSTHFRCDTYNGKSCDANTQKAYESSLKAIGDEAKAALTAIKE
jgi:hypothetical protein